MDTLVRELDIGSWKPVITAFLLPPVPFLLMLLGGALLLWMRRASGWLLTLFAISGLWLGSCAGFGEALSAIALKPPAALKPQQLAALKRDSQARRNVAIVVLGGGREAYAPEYGVSSLTGPALERLRYGVWLGREIAAPVGFLGGVGWMQVEGPSEAQIAARIAAAEFGRPLRWVEEDSRDTRENARRALPLMLRDGITELVVVTHGWHMPRALRAFDEAANGRLRVTAAPMGLAPRVDSPVLRWLPSSDGHVHVRQVVREWIGLRAGS
jgi:uncharacterized SAM-binding protein YcdF (DUF218 family)